MKTFIAVVFIYFNIVAVTLVICNRECGPPIEIGTGTLQLWSKNHECRHWIPLKGIFWPIYWTYRFWDKVL